MVSDKYKVVTIIIAMHFVRKSREKEITVWVVLFFLALTPLLGYSIKFFGDISPVKLAKVIQYATGQNQERGNHCPC